jgi:hypothetical protein
MRYRLASGLGLLLGLGGLVVLAFGVPAAARPAASGPSPTRTATATTTPVSCFAWQVVQSPNATLTDTHRLSAAAAAGPADVWAVGWYGTTDSSYTCCSRTLIEHWNGATWSIVASPSPAATGFNGLRGVVALSATNVWAVGYATGSGALILHWDGTAWAMVPNPSPSTNTSLDAISAVSPNDIWAVGQSDDGAYTIRTVTMHWDGQTWQLVSSPNYRQRSYLFGVKAFAANDAWAVGWTDSDNNPAFYPPYAIIMHWNGTTWQDSPNPGDSILNAVDGVAATDLWAVGFYGGPNFKGILHGNGSSWANATTLDRAEFYSVNARTATDIWTVGSIPLTPETNTFRSVTAHWDGTSWQVFAAVDPAPTKTQLYGVAAPATGDIWAVGASGGRTLIERYVGGCPAVTPTPVPPPPPPTATPTPCTAGQFSDVQPSDYFYAAVGYLVSRGVLSGYSDCTFRPYDRTTRGQLAKLVTLGFQMPLMTPPPLESRTFNDVLPDNVFYLAIETAAHAGVISGYTCGGTNPQTGVGEPCDAAYRPYYRPGSPVSRGQLAKIIVGAAGWGLLAPSDPHFSDVGADSAFYLYIETAVCHGILGGYSDGTFRPGNNATRGQVAKILYLAITGDPGACSSGTATPTPPIPADTPTPTPIGTVGPASGK